MNNVVINPYEYFADPTKGRPIFNGSVYIGQPDTDPEVPANQKQVYARQEDGNDVAIPQPVLTNAGGYPTYNGSVVIITVQGSYSVKVNDKQGNQLLYQALVSSSNATVTATPSGVSKTLGEWTEYLATPETIEVTATGTTTARSLADRFGDGVNVKDFGAIGDGSDATAAIAVAKAAGAVYMPDGSYPDSNNGEFYLYPSNMENDGGFYRYSVGGTTTQSSDPRPVMMIEKVVNTDKGALGNFDAGGLYVQINKRGGDALVTGITGYVKSITGVSDCIGVHGRVQLNGKNNNDLTGSEGFGGWSYCDINPTGGGLVTEGIGHEIDIRNRGGDIQFNKAPLPPGSTQGEYRGLVVVTADNSAGYCSHAIDVGAQTGSKGWYTGLRLRKDGIAPAVTLGIDTCQLRVQGALTSPNRYGGVSFDDGYLSYGLNFATGAVFDSDKAIVLATNQKIFFDNNFRHLSWNGTNYNFNQGGIAINGTMVINSQQPTIANATDAASAITQLNAVIATLKAHGLIES